MRILLIEDSPDFAGRIMGKLSDYQFVWKTKAEDAAKCLGFSISIDNGCHAEATKPTESPFDIILCDNELASRITGYQMLECIEAGINKARKAKLFKKNLSNIPPIIKISSVPESMPIAEKLTKFTIAATVRKSDYQNPDWVYQIEEEVLRVEG